MKSGTEREYRRRIARVVAAIVAEPSAPHTVESLSAIAHVSPYHFHRIYKSLTGETIAETVQRLRLADAANRLTNNLDTVTDVAANVGYDSAQAFARAFRKFTGVSPGEFRARQLDIMESRQVPTDVGETYQRSTSDCAQTIATVELPPVMVLGLRHDGPPSTIGHTYRALLRSLGIDAASARNHQVIGLCSGNPKDGASFQYIAGVVQTADLNPPRSVQPIRLEGGLYASQRLVGPYALIGPTFRALFDGWLPLSAYMPDERPALELYRDPPLSGLKRQSVTDLAIPIKKR
jgi:AraC family transcriptional regulator